jgi:hypothetical protein
MFCDSPGASPGCRSGLSDNERYHESLDNVTPADVYYGRRYEVISEQSKIKRIAMQRRKKEHLAERAASAEAKNRLLAKAVSSPRSFDDVHHSSPLS